jgi:hypothetical protein
VDSASLAASSPDVAKALARQQGLGRPWPPGTLRQLSRLTLTCGEVGAAAEALQAGAAVPLTYDIVAVQPTTERIFQQVG